MCRDLNSSSSDRDEMPPPAPWPGTLLADYVALAKSRPNAAEAMALRTRSTVMRRIFAHAASLGKLDEAEFRRTLLAGNQGEFDPLWLAKYARVASLQQLLPGDTDVGLAALDIAFRALPTNKLTARYRKLHVELLLDVGEIKRAKTIVENDGVLRERWPHFRADLQNPVLTGNLETEAGWIHEFNHIYRKYGLAPVELAEDGRSPFDRLNVHSGAPRSVTEGPLVSVIMTTYKPDPEALRNSMNSVLNQTWKNLEILLVDDGSPEPYRSWISKLSETDDRIRLLVARENGGTYVARNLGIKNAQGRYITGQDDDDWSHPERIERQVAALEHRRSSGTVVTSLRANSELLVSSPGTSPIGGAAASFMTYTRLAREVGGYLHMRKAADNEFLHRIEAYSNRRVVSLREPLMTVRRRDESLSRSDYRPGWSHPARRSFRNAYLHWHKSANGALLRSGGLLHGPPPIAVPEHLIGVSNTPLSLDVVLAGNWQENRSAQRSMLQEIRALRAHKLRVGVLNIESARVMARVPKPLIGPIQTLINEGAVSEILPESQARAKLLILRNPSLLQFPPAQVYGIKVERLLIIADESPRTADGIAAYDPTLCADHAANLFGVRGRWIAPSSTSRASLARVLPPGEVTEEVHCAVVNLGDWRSDRNRDLGQRPIVGWLPAARGTVLHDRDDFRDLLPSDGSVDIRIRGDASQVLRAFEFDRLPANWLVYSPSDIPMRAFFYSVDFLVYDDADTTGFNFPHVIVEALASGCVVILPPRFEEFFGAAAVYVELSDAQEVISAFHRDPHAYRKQAKVAIREVASRFGEERFGSFVRAHIDSNSVEYGVPVEGVR